MDNAEFKKQIDELFRLFNKLMEKHKAEEIPGINSLQLEQMKMFLRNYETMKDHISFEMMGQMNEPMRQMIGMFIQQLKQELGEESIAELQDKPIEIQIDTIEHIDAMLRRPGLNEVEIDRLLDERARLVAERNKPQI